jgi:hypothetical protein
MTDYTITTNFGAKDSLPSGNAGKVIKGSEFTTEFTNIQTAVNTKADTAGDTFTGVVNFSADVAVNTNTLFVDVSEDKVGIGTTTPDTSLHVDGGDVKISSDSATSNGDGKPTIFFSESGADEVYAQISYHGDDESGTDNFIGIGCSGAVGTTEALMKENHQMVVKSSGNVGIGTTTISNPVNYSKVLNIAGTAPALVLSEDSGRDYTIGVNGNKLFIFDENDTVMTIDDSGNVLVGKTSYGVQTQGFGAYSSGAIEANGGNATAAYFNRTTGDGELLNFRKDNTTVGSISAGASSGGTNPIAIGFGTSGLWFIPAAQAIAPFNMTTNAGSDNSVDLGYSSLRFDDIYATNGTIQTSDRNEKQGIRELLDAEQRVATACKGLLRAFKWNSAVEEKGDEARIHFGIIAQDLQDAFTAEGLDAGDYAMFINSTWTDEETGEERSRMGVRYSELLAFIISAI